MTATLAFLGFIIVQRLTELVIAKRNTAALMRRGAQEHGASHYPFMVALHTLWIVSLVTFGHDQQIIWFWLVLFVALQFLRVWILATLGQRWTTRIIVLDEPLVLGGPFKVLRHPNYVLVVAEIFVAPMVLGLWQIAIVFSVLNAAMLYVRIGVEDKALQHLRDLNP